MWLESFLCLKDRSAMSSELSRPGRSGQNRYKIEVLMSRMLKLKGLVAASLRVRTFDDYP